MIRVMNACYSNIYNQRVNWYTLKGIWFVPLQILMKDNRYKIIHPNNNNNHDDNSFETLSEIFSKNRIKNNQSSYHYK